MKPTQRPEHSDTSFTGLMGKMSGQLESPL